jgi:ubiquitin C-terminal hydrolase
MHSAEQALLTQAVADHPPVLVVRLLRYRLGADGAHAQRLGHLVSYGESLRIGTAIYQLQASIQHLPGQDRQRADSGHYVTYARRGGVWYCFNDSSVSRVTFADVPQRDTYMLVYLRTDQPAPHEVSALSTVCITDSQQAWCRHSC